MLQVTVAWWSACLTTMQVVRQQNHAADKFCIFHENSFGTR